MIKVRKEANGGVNATSVVEKGSKKRGARTALNLRSGR